MILSLLLRAVYEDVQLARQSVVRVEQHLALHIQSVYTLVCPTPVFLYFNDFLMRIHQVDHFVDKGYTLHDQLQAFEQDLPSPIRVGMDGAVILGVSFADGSATQRAAGRSFCPLVETRLVEDVVAGGGDRRLFFVRNDVGHAYGAFAALLLIQVAR